MSVEIRARQQPQPMPTLLLFPASLRQHSHQRRLIEYLASLLAGRCHIDILSASEVKLPLFNQDLERSPEVIGELMTVYHRFAGADGIVVASPEYNGHVSPYLKNTVDWVSRITHIDPEYAGANPFREKPLLLASASTGWTGGVLGLQDARSIFAYLGCLVSSEQICLSHAEESLVGDAYEFDPFFANYIAQTVDHFVSLVLRNRAPAITPCLEVASQRDRVTSGRLPW